MILGSVWIGRGAISLDLSLERLAATQAGALGPARITQTGQPDTNQLRAWWDVTDDTLVVDLPRLEIDSISSIGAGLTVRAGRLVLTGLHAEVRFPDDRFERPSAATADLASVDLTDLLASTAELMAGAARTRVQTVHLEVGRAGPGRDRFPPAVVRRAHPDPRPADQLHQHAARRVRPSTGGSTRCGSGTSAPAWPRSRWRGWPTPARISASVPRSPPARCGSPTSTSGWACPRPPCNAPGSPRSRRRRERLTGAAASSPAATALDTEITRAQAELDRLPRLEEKVLLALEAQEQREPGSLTAEQRRRAAELHRPAPAVAAPSASARSSCSA